MTFEELATKGDLVALENRLISILQKIVPEKEKKVLSFDEACEYLGGMKKGTLRQKACTFEIASHKNGKNLVFERKDLDEYLAATRRMSSAELTARVRTR